MNNKNIGRIPDRIAGYSKSIDDVTKPKYSIQNSQSTARGGRYMLPRYFLHTSTTSRLYEVLTHFVRYGSRSLPGTGSYTEANVTKYLYAMLRYISALTVDWLLDRGVMQRADGINQRWTLAVDYVDANNRKPKAVATRKKYGMSVAGLFVPKIIVDLAVYSAWARRNGDDVLFPMKTMTATEFDIVLGIITTNLTDFNEWMSQSKDKVGFVALNLTHWFDRELVIPEDEEWFKLMGLGPFASTGAAGAVVVKGFLDLVSYIPSRLDLVLLRSLISEAPPATTDGGSTIDETQHFVYNEVYNAGVGNNNPLIYATKSGDVAIFGTAIDLSMAECSCFAKYFYKSLGIVPVMAYSDLGLYVWNHKPYSSGFDIYSFKEDVLSVLLMGVIPGYNMDTFLTGSDPKPTTDNKRRDYKPKFDRTKSFQGPKGLNPADDADGILPPPKQKGADSRNIAGTKGNVKPDFKKPFKKK